MVGRDPALVGLVVFEHRKIRDPKKTIVAALEKAMLGGVLLAEGDPHESGRRVDRKFRGCNLALLRRMVVFAGLRGANDEDDEVLGGCTRFLANLRGGTGELALDPLEVFEDSRPAFRNEQRLEVVALLA